MLVERLDELIAKLRGGGERRRVGLGLDRFDRGGAQRLGGFAAREAAKVHVGAPQPLVALLDSGVKRGEQRLFMPCVPIEPMRDRALNLVLDLLLVVDAGVEQPR